MKVKVHYAAVAVLEILSVNMAVVLLNRCPSYNLLYMCSFFSMLEQSHWLDYINQLLGVTNQVVEAIAINSRPVLVHCSDGWDRTAQVVSLAELLLDPYYRTIKVGRCMTL